MLLSFKAHIHIQVRGCIHYISQGCGLEVSTLKFWWVTVSQGITLNEVHRYDKLTVGTKETLCHFLCYSISQLKQ